MNYFLCHKRIIFVTLFYLASFVLFAQEIDLYKQLIKESIKLDFRMDSLTLTSRLDVAPEYVEWDIRKNPLIPMGFNRLQNSLYLHFKDSLPINERHTISPYLTAAYTNESYNPIVPSIYNYQNMIPPVIYTQLTGAGFLSINGLTSLIFYLIPQEEPSALPLSKHQKALKHITENIYPADF
jgi:hypothetical protein